MTICPPVRRQWEFCQTSGQRAAVLSPRQRSTVGDVKDLMRVQKLPEAVEQLSALQTAALRVDKHQQRTDIAIQPVVLRDDKTITELQVN